MQPTDLTIEILKGIRDEVRTTNVRLDALRLDTNDRFDALRLDVNTRFDETNQHLDRLARRHIETEVRLSTELVAVVGAVHEVRDLLREDRALRDTVDDHERRIAAIETRAG
jgi:predicted HAD superfamily phosphohydrolase